MDLLGFFGIIISLAFLIVAVYKGYHVLPVSLISALIAILTNNVSIWDTFSSGYMADFTNFAANYLIIFLLGALLGQIMSKTGAASKIALGLLKVFGDNNAVFLTMLIATILSFGGISVFVIVFAIYPVALKLYERADIPKRLIPGNVMLGAGTYAMTALPGSPALTNLIPTTYLGTTTSAAPLLGVLSALVMMVSGYLIYTKYVSIVKAKGERFEDQSSPDLINIEKDESTLPNLLVSLLPVVITISIIFAERILKLNYPSSQTIIVALLSGVICATLLLLKKGDFKDLLNLSAINSIGALMNTASVVGLGGTIKMVPIFKSFVALATSINLTPLVSVALAVNIIAAITGSSSAGISIFMETMSQSYLVLGVHPEVLHRIAAIASGVLDSLPHAGPNITFLAIAGLKFKEGYPGIFITTCFVPFIGLIAAIIFASFGII